MAGVWPGMQWAPKSNYGAIGQYSEKIDMGYSGGARAKKEEPEDRPYFAGGGYGYTYGYGTPSAYPPQNPWGYGGGGGAYPHQQYDGEAYRGYPPQKAPPAAAGGHRDPPPPSPAPAHEPPPPPSANKEAEADMPLEGCPKNEGKPSSPCAAVPVVQDPPRKDQQYGQPHPGPGTEGAGYRDSRGGGNYHHPPPHPPPPPQGWGYPPAPPPPGRYPPPAPYQGGQWGGGYGGAQMGMGWPAPAPPAGAYPPAYGYGAGYGGHYGYGGYGGNGKYTMGHEGQFKQYAHHQGIY